jgi:hypothetical protein
MLEAEKSKIEERRREGLQGGDWVRVNWIDDEI